MKVIMVAVVSANGKLTNGDDEDIYKWTSDEDQKFFFDLINKASLIVMGSGTYRAVKRRLKHNSERLRLVLTKTPDKYSADMISGRLEFSSESPRQIFDRFSSKYSTMLLTGGSKIYSSFAKEGLINEIYLTIEPKVFGSGKELFDDQDFDLNLKLESSETLNRQGTLLLKYKVNK